MIYRIILLKILEHIINIASKENDIVLDMFMGVGSTGVAALNLNRRFIGIELDKTYYDASVKRLGELNNSPFLSFAYA